MLFFGFANGSISEDTKQPKKTCLQHWSGTMFASLLSGGCSISSGERRRRSRRGQFQFFRSLEFSFLLSLSPLFCPSLPRLVCWLFFFFSLFSHLTLSFVLFRPSLSFLFFSLAFFPTDPFTILKSHDQEIAEFCVVQERRKTYFEAPKLGKGRSGFAGWQLDSNSACFH